MRLHKEYDIGKQIIKLINMVKNVDDVHRVKNQAKEVRKTCFNVREVLEKYDIAISSLPLIISSAETIAKKGYNTDDMEDTVQVCEGMLELEHFVKQKLGEAADKIHDLKENKEEQAKVAKESYERILDDSRELSDEEKVLYKLEKVID